jgi:peptide chain release factor subunit 1
MAETLTWNRLRELAAFRSDGGCAISLYLNLDPALSPTAKDVDTRLSSMLADAEKRIEARRDQLTHAEREGLKRDLARIRAYFDGEFSREGAQGFAVFAAGDDYWATLALAYSVPDAVQLGREFHLAPLAPLVGRGDGAIVAVVGRERGEIFRLRAGRLEEVVDRTEEQPGKHDQGGWSQARYQRHIEKLVGEHLRGVAQELDREVRQLHTPKVVLVGAEETRSEFLETLPHDAKAAVVGAAEAEAHAAEPELLELVQPLLDRAHANDEAAVLERWREEVAKNARGTAGWKDTLDAASDARVELLLYQERADQPAHQCPKCGRAALDGGECPLDGTPMEKRESGFDLAVHQTAQHGGTLLTLRHHDDLGPVEGIGALLRY